MAITIADLIKMEKLSIPRNVKLNGIDVPKKVLSEKWDELVGKICFINQFPIDGIIVPYENTMGRLISISPKGDCRFERKNGSKFSVHVDDIKELKLFISKNYHQNGN